MKKMRISAIVVAIAVAVMVPFGFAQTEDGAVRLSAEKACAQDGDGCGCIYIEDQYCYHCGGDENWYCNFGCIPPPPE